MRTNWYKQKDLVTGNAHVLYKSSSTELNKVRWLGQTPKSRSQGKKMLVSMERLFKYRSEKSTWAFSSGELKIGQTPRSRSQGKRWWYPWKDYITRNTLVKYQISSYQSSKVIGNTTKVSDTLRVQQQYSPNLWSLGHKNTKTNIAVLIKTQLVLPIWNLT